MPESTLRHPPTATAPSRRDRRQAEGRPLSRTIISAILITLACVLAPLSAVSVWARGEVTDTDRYLATVGPLASNPTIQNAVSARITDEVFQYVDITGLTKQAVGAIADQANLSPEQRQLLTALEAPIDNGIKSFTGEQVTKLVQSEAFANAWVEANKVASTEINDLLSGNGQSSLALKGDAVVLNLGDLTAKVKSALVAKGFTVAEKIPAVNTEVTVFQSNDIPKIQTAYSLLNTLGYWLPLIAAALAVIGVLVANNKRRAMLGFGIGLAVAMLVGGVALAIARAGYINALPQGVNLPAATVFFDAFINFLKQSLWAGFAAGVIIGAGAVMSGPTRFAVGVRGIFVTAAAAIQRQLASWGATMTSVRRWVSAQAPALRIAATIGALGFIMLQRYKTSPLVIWTAVVLLVVLFLIQILASGDDVRGGRGGFDEDADQPAPPVGLPAAGGSDAAAGAEADDAVKVGASAAAPTEAGGAGAGPTGSGESLTKAD